MSGKSVTATQWRYRVKISGIVDGSQNKRQDMDNAPGKSATSSAIIWRGKKAKRQQRAQRKSGAVTVTLAGTLPACERGASRRRMSRRRAGGIAKKNALRRSRCGSFSAGSGFNMGSESKQRRHRACGAAPRGALAASARTRRSARGAARHRLRSSALRAPQRYRRRGQA